MFTIMTVSTIAGSPRLCRHAVRCMAARGSFLPDSTIPSSPYKSPRSGWPAVSGRAIALAVQCSHVVLGSNQFHQLVLVHRQICFAEQLCNRARLARIELREPDAQRQRGFRTREIVGRYRALQTMPEEIAGIRITDRNECCKFISTQPANDDSVGKNRPQYLGGPRQPRIT